MAPVNDPYILEVWKALPTDSITAGWRTIDLVQIGPCRIKAAKYLPDNLEALLVGFPDVVVAPNSQLPQGKGFKMVRAGLGKSGGDHQWLAIVRQPTGPLELFATMVADISNFLASSEQLNEQLLYRRFLGRVRGWQEFMRRGGDGLSSEAELGLVGELNALSMLVTKNVPLYTVVNSWKGPAGGLHDYSFGTGALEVKSTMTSGAFRVRITSLEQLDDPVIPPLYLMAMRFSDGDRGKTLTQIIEGIRSHLDADLGASILFEQALLDVGYLDMHSDKYTQRYQLHEVRIHLVDAEFPRLTSSSISPCILRAQYELDLSLINAENCSFDATLTALGVIDGTH
ncbi:PD-(D/E)XK motif protein [Halopseudomonas laoshanensis]|uniref:PD-(D/E)XK motif protein n=1 Tax=Halopseudomonas laoshanensis TaxID=2268758 RepID=UPI0037361B3C